MIYKLIILIKFIYRSLKTINHAHIGRIAYYSGEKVVLKNGVCHPYWKVKLIETGEQIERIHLLEVVLDNSFYAQYKAFKFHFKWLMGNHYQVEVQKLKYPHIFELTKSKSSR